MELFIGGLAKAVSLVNLLFDTVKGFEDRFKIIGDSLLMRGVDFSAHVFSYELVGSFPEGERIGDGFCEGAGFGLGVASVLLPIV